MAKTAIPAPRILKNSRVRPTAADIALQKLDNLRGTWIAVALQQSDAAHDHPSRAVGALKGAGIEKGLLHGMQMSVFLQAFNGGDGLANRGADGNLAGTPRHPADQHSASAALAFAAT